MKRILWSLMTLLFIVLQWAWITADTSTFWELGDSITRLGSHYQEKSKKLRDVTTWEHADRKEFMAISCSK